MIAPDCGVPSCRRTVSDGTPICGHCWAGLVRRLPDVIDQLIVTLTKQDHLGGTGGRGKGAAQPLPVRLDVGPVLDAVSGELIGWARDLVETYRLTVPGPPASAHPQLALAAYAARFLAEHVGRLRTHPAAAEAYRAITQALEMAEAKMDRPEPTLFIGRCEGRDGRGCGANLYARQDAKAVTCRSCGVTVADVGYRWRSALDKLRGYPATAATIASSIGELYGVTVNAATIRKWHQREEITPVDWVALAEGGERTVPRFRIGAVLDRAARNNPRKAG